MTVFFEGRTLVESCSHHRAAYRVLDPDRFGLFGDRGRRSTAAARS